MHWGPYPDWQRGQVSAHTLPPRALEGEVCPQAMAVALDARLEWSWGCHLLVLAAWPGCSFPQTATRGQPAPSAEEFSVAQVMAS